MEEYNNTGISPDESGELDKVSEYMQNTSPDVQKPDDPEVPDAEEKEDIYVYDAADDEPVDDRDFYRDLSVGAAVSKPSVPAAEAHGAPEPESVNVCMTDVRVTGTPMYERPEEPEQPETHIVHDEAEPRQPVRVNRIYMVNTVISMITLCAVAASVFTGYAYIKRLEQELGLSKRRISDLEETRAVTEEAPKDDFVDAVSLIEEEELKEPEIPDNISEVDIERGKLLLYDSYVGYSWVPVISGVKPHSYNKENFKVDNDYRMQYIVDGEVSSYFGIDVSSYQGDIDWDAVRSDGVEFAILRIGVRGYAEEGNIKLDDKFIENYDKAHKAGIDLGVYFYSQAISVDEAVEEANFVLEQLGDRKLEYPVVFDWEPVDTASSDITPRTEDVMPGTLTLSAVAFCETIRDAGYEAMIYTNKKMAYIKYDMRKLVDYPVWLALYNTDLTYYYDFDMWQYGFGRVDGIEGDVDLDIAIIR